MAIWYHHVSLESSSTTYRVKFVSMHIGAIVSVKRGQCGVHGIVNEVVSDEWVLFFILEVIFDHAQIYVPRHIMKRGGDCLTWYKTIICWTYEYTRSGSSISYTNNNSMLDLVFLTNLTSFRFYNCANKVSLWNTSCNYVKYNYVYCNSFKIVSFLS